MKRTYISRAFRPIVKPDLTWNQPRRHHVWIWRDAGDDHVLGAMVAYVASDLAPILHHEVGRKRGLIQAGFPVPPGFAVTTETFHLFVERHQLADRRQAGELSTDDTAGLERTAEDLRHRMEAGQMPDVVATSKATSAAPASANRWGKEADDRPKPPDRARDMSSESQLACSG